MYHIMLFKNYWKFQLNVDHKKEEKYLIISIVEKLIILTDENSHTTSARLKK